MFKIEPVYKKLTVVLIVIQLLFLGNLSYLYGSAFQYTKRIHNFNVLAVNLDDGVVADSFVRAYDHLKANTFPTFHFVSADQFNHSTELINNEVVNGHYWAAIYTNANTSNELLDAIANGGAAAQSYNSSKAITYTWNEARYPAFSDSIIGASLTTYVAATRSVFNHKYGATGLERLNTTDAAALQVFLNPIGSTSDNIQSTVQGVRQYMNTISVAMMVLQQFFLVLGPNLMILPSGLYKRWTWQRLGALRFSYAILATFLSGLTTAGYYWAFRETWAVNGNQFVLTWMTLWLLNLTFHLFLYGVSCILPVPFLPIVLVTFIFLNVTSSATPFDMNPGFYRVGYAIPAYNGYQILTDIWSGGRVHALYRSLPILFSWIIVTSVFAVVAHRKMCIKLKNAPPPGGASQPPPSSPQPAIIKDEEKSLD